MIETDDKHIMFIEPSGPAASVPLDDELTMRMRGAMRLATPSSYAFRGWHTCICGARSDNRDWFLTNGQKTHTLAIHYLACHRGEVPESELEKVRNL